jgi:hypothetical protein
VARFCLGIRYGRSYVEGQKRAFGTVAEEPVSKSQNRIVTATAVLEASVKFTGTAAATGCRSRHLVVRVEDLEPAVRCALAAGLVVEDVGVDIRHGWLGALVLDGVRNGVLDGECLARMVGVVPTYPRLLSAA